MLREQQQAQSGSGSCSCSRFPAAAATAVSLVHVYPNSGSSKGEQGDESGCWRGRCLPSASHPPVEVWESSLLKAGRKRKELREEQQEQQEETMEEVEGRESVHEQSETTREARVADERMFAPVFSRTFREGRQRGSAPMEGKVRGSQLRNIKNTMIALN